MQTNRGFVDEQGFGPFQTSRQLPASRWKKFCTRKRKATRKSDAHKCIYTLGGQLGTKVNAFKGIRHFYGREITTRRESDSRSDIVYHARNFSW
jgi:hypothetical protein